MPISFDNVPAAWQQPLTNGYNAMPGLVQTCVHAVNYSGNHRLGALPPLVRSARQCQPESCSVCPECVHHLGDLEAKQDPPLLQCHRQCRIRCRAWRMRLRVAVGTRRSSDGRSACRQWCTRWHRRRHGLPRVVHGRHRSHHLPRVGAQARTGLRLQHRGSPARLRPRCLFGEGAKQPGNGDDQCGQLPPLHEGCQPHPLDRG